MLKKNKTQLIKVISGYVSAETDIIMVKHHYKVHIVGLAKILLVHNINLLYPDGNFEVDL
jgi:hypothetical protein